MNAYDKDIMLAARDTFAVMIDYAVTWCGKDLRSFYNRFLGSLIDKAFGTGHPKFTLGMSGIELAGRVYENTGGELPLDGNYRFPYQDSSHYWTGWALAQYQWYKGVSFASIDRNGLPIEKIHELFHPLHEADITKVFAVFDTYYRPKAVCLKEFRKRRGLTQEELARRSGVSLRMVRAYEQGQQDLSRAESSTLLRLSQALNCPPERLIEGLD
jgi:DNA-binding XRE family transcriptional regulator